jgi:large repetitive protein
MASLPGFLPPDVLNWLQSARSLLDLIDLAAAPDALLNNPPRKQWQGSLRPAEIANLTYDPATGRFAVKQNNGTGSDVADGGDPDSWLSFPDPTIVYDLTVETDPTHTHATGPFDLKLTLPEAVLTFPQLRGAKLDNQNLLVEDPANPKVRFHLPKLVVRIKRTTTTGDPSTTLESALADPNIFQFCRMEPPHALVGPGTVLGFTFRAAILDLSSATNPPAAARSIPANWQGIHIPEARIYVAPNGLEDLAVAAGVEDLWIGIGQHRGVTGTFELDVVNRGTSPAIRVRFHDQSGRYIGTSGTAPNLTALLAERTIIVVDAAGGIAPYTTSITINGTTNAATRADVTTPATGTLTIDVSVTDAGAHVSNVQIVCSRQVTAPAPVPGEGLKPITITATGAQRVIGTGNQDNTSIELTLSDTRGTVTWDAPPASPTTGPVTRVIVTPGATVNVTAHRNLPAGQMQTLPIYYHYDHPTASEDDGPPPSQHFNYSRNVTNTSGGRAIDETSPNFTGLPITITASFSPLLSLPAATPATVTGFASFDGTATDTTDHRNYNLRLSERRAKGAAALLAENFPNLALSFGVSAGDTESRSNQPAGRPEYWKATVSYATPAVDETLTAVLRRAPSDHPPPPVTPTDPEPARPGFPDWFHRVGLKCRLERSEIVLLEINGEIDIRTGAERFLASNDPQATLPPPPPASDGISQFVLRLDLDRTASEWKVTASFRAVEQDTNGLFMVERDNNNTLGTNLLGGFSALGPVLAAVAPPSPAEGNVVPLVLVGGGIVALAATDRLKTKSVKLQGGELVIQHGPRGTDYVVLLDVETKIGFDAGVVAVSLDKPITTRYKALGLKLGDRDGGAFQVRPMFDASRGYSLDIPEGAITAAGPLGDLLKIFGARVSKDNPTYLEIEVGIGAELGIVTIDRARVRFRLDAAEIPTLTALGASIDVPGAFTGRGYVQISPGELAGFFDISIAPPIGIRASAGLKISSANGVQGVFIGARIEFPAPIPLANSGLGIYGFAAALGVNMERTPAPTPLAWLAGLPNRDPLHVSGWRLKAGGWAFAVGATLGTIDGGIILKMQGLLMLELPGPRVLVLMKAKILATPPDPAQYPILAVIDISPDSLTIGLLAEYDFASIVRLKVPVRLFFDFSPAENWQFDLGTFSEPVLVSILDLFRGSGYFMIHGMGINPPPPALSGLPVTSGITLAVGFHVELVWGSTSIGLYAKVASGLDAFVSSKPIFVAGKITLSGELRLFIVSIGASAELDAETDGTQYHVHGKICGHVDFFFFSVEGCVDFTLNSPVPRPHIAPPLIDSLVLVSRSPALVEGSGSDTAIDGVLVTVPSPDAGTPVPLDAVPVLTFGVTPEVEATFQVLGGKPLATPGTAFNPWVKRGADWWRYKLLSVTISPVPGPGDTPVTWWARKPTVDPQEGTRLALLSWLPMATPRAVPYGEKLTTMVHDAWGDVCTPVADAAPTLYTWDLQAIGESRTGWRLPGVMWPDPPGTYRSDRENEDLHVTERWRSGFEQTDRLRGIDAADVVGGAVACARTDSTRPTLQQLAAGSFGPGGGSMMLSSSALALSQVTNLLAGGGSPREVVARMTADSVFKRHVFDCQGRVLRSPSGDSAEPSRFGPESDRKFVERAWDFIGFKPDDLVNGVTLHTGHTTDITLLFAVPEVASHGITRFRCLSEDNAVVQEFSIDTVTTFDFGAIPARWWDPNGPWRSPVERCAELLAWIAQREKMLVGVARVKMPEKAVALQIAQQPDAAKKGNIAPFYLAAIEMLTDAEMQRMRFDEHTQTVRRDTLSTVLSTEIDNYAMLDPGQSYTVNVKWTAAYKESTARPAVAEPGISVGEQTQTFSFNAQTVAQVPKRLDPWVLDTDPGDHEGAAFCDDAVRLSFATQNVAKLFKKYGHDIRLVLHGSSGRHPNPSGPPTISSLPLAQVLDIKVTGSTGLRITTPWEETVRDLIAASLPCIPPGVRDEHISVVVPFPLDPQTDYLIDLVLQPTGGGESMLAYRHGFTTSRFRSLPEFAGTMRDVVAEHRAIANPGALTALPIAPNGPAVDKAFASAGIDPLGVPKMPRVMVLWTTDAVPQPVAVVIDANEPLWRRRIAPTKVPQPPQAPDPRDLTGHHWAMRPFTWLNPTTAGSAGVMRIVEAPGSQRAIVLLNPNQRGALLSINLQRHNDPVTGTGAASAQVCGITLDAAPWEDL